MRALLTAVLIVAITAPAAVATAAAGTLPAGAVAAGAVAAATDASAVEAGPQARTDRQLLVMLRMPPPHLRPDADYAGNYQTAPGREARRRIARAIAQAHGLQLIDDWPMPALGLDCFVMEAGSLSAREQVVQQLSSDPRIESAQPMGLFHALADGDPLSAAQPAVTGWHLRELHALATGRNVVVASVDTGVDVGHPDLRGRGIVTRNFVGTGASPAEAHGTEVLGIIGARSDDGIGITGVAPQSRLLALRACWPQSNRPAHLASGEVVCSSFTLAKALQFAIDAHVQVLNLSLSGPADPLLGRLLDVAFAQGMSVVAAVDPHRPDGGFPSTHHDVLAVAVNRAGGDGPGFCWRRTAPSPPPPVAAAGAWCRARRSPPRRSAAWWRCCVNWRLPPGQRSCALPSPRVLS